MENWFYRKDNMTMGPVSEERLQSMLSVGLLPPDTFIWDGNLDENGNAKWKKANEPEPEPSSILEDVILNIIQFSKPANFSTGKLEKYLALLEKLYPIGTTIVLDPRFDTPYVPEMRPCIKCLKEKNLIKAKAKGQRRYFEPLSAPPELPSELKKHLHDLIKEHDKSSGSKMPWPESLSVE